MSSEPADLRASSVLATRGLSLFTVDLDVVVVVVDDVDGDGDVDLAAPPLTLRSFL